MQLALRIVVDDRERPSGVAEALRSRSHVDITFRRLKLGDYEVGHHLIVERKTLADFAISVRDGRLFGQAGRLAKHQEIRPCMILEGTPERYPRLAIPKTAFQGALITVTLVFGLPVLRSATPEETADLILYAADQLHRRAALPPRRTSFRSGSLRRNQLHLLQAIPMVGPLRAEALLSAMAVPSQVAEAGVEALTEIDGIGPAIASNIHRVMHLDTNETIETGS